MWIFACAIGRTRKHNGGRGEEGGVDQMVDKFPVVAVTVKQHDKEKRLDLYTTG